MSGQSSKILLERILALKENTQFILVLDSLAQSSYYLIQEFAHRSTSSIIFLSFETIRNPIKNAIFIDCIGKSFKDTIDVVNKEILKLDSLNKVLVITDSVNCIPVKSTLEFITQIIKPNVSLLCVYHKSLIQAKDTKGGYPSQIDLLKYTAGTIFEVAPILTKDVDEEDIDNGLKRLALPIKCGLNESVFKAILFNKRKSGRLLSYAFIIDAASHSCDLLRDESEQAGEINENSIIENLTTFNLSTNSKQRLAREQVELPFMQAQETLGSMGGAIVYEFEKDDDYDEEDPYEDPF